MLGKGKSGAPPSIGLTACMVLLCVSLTGLPARASVPNYEQVSVILHRGGAPSEDDLEELAGKGVKTVIDLRLNALKAHREARRARALGLEHFHIPLGFISPAKRKVEKILAIITDPRYQPVFIHCRQGADRTGALVAIHQVVHDRVEFDDAYRQMRKHHFKPWLISLRRTVEGYADSVHTQ